MSASERVVAAVGVGTAAVGRERLGWMVGGARVG
jgi:hypothetical protein